MQCEWNLDVVKFGLLNWYSQFHNHQARPTFIDYCNKATVEQLSTMNLQGFNFQRVYFKNFVQSALQQV